MLSDLIQFFTKRNKNENMATDNEMSLAYMLEFFYKYTSADDIRNGIETGVIYGPDSFYELDELWFDDMYMNDMHLGDCLNISYENNFAQLVFSTFLNEMDFYIDFCDTDSYSLFDGEYGSDKTMTQFTGFEIPHKIDKYINNWIKKEIEKYITIDGERIDQYFLETTRVIFMHVELKNKSIARKLRRAYSENSIVKDMFLNMNIYMENGEFVVLLIYDAEYGMNSDYIDLHKIYDGINEIRKILNRTSVNKVGRGLQIAFHNLSRDLYQAERFSKGYHYSFFIRIMKEHSAPKEEVIL